MSSDYRLAAPFIVRMLGAVMILGGLLVLALALVVGLAGWSGAVLSAGIVVVVTGVLLAVLTALVARRSAPVVRLDEAGYRVRWVRGAGERSGRWREVEDVVAATVAGERCVVLRRRDGSATTIPVDILAGRSDDFLLDLQRHLNRGHGYRPLR